MGGLVVISGLAVLAAAALLPILLPLRMRREDRREEADAQAMAEAAFRANGYAPDQVLCCGTAPHQIHLLVDNRRGILRLDIQRGGADYRRDMRFRDLLGCQLLENGAAVSQVGKAMAGLPPEERCSQPGAVQSMQLVLYLSDALEPAVGFDLLLLPVSRTSPAFQEAEAFADQVMDLVRHILEESRRPSL